MFSSPFIFSILQIIQKSFFYKEKNTTGDEKKKTRHAVFLQNFRNAVHRISVSLNLILR